MDCSRNSIYFTGDSFCTALVFFGAVLFWAGIGALLYGKIREGVVLELLAGVIVILGIWRRIILEMTDSEYDSTVARFAYSLKPRALSKLGIDESEVNEIAPIFMGGYDFESADKFKEGQDKKLRSNVYKFIMIFFSRNEIHCYTIKFMTTEAFILGEATDVYFYQDIVSASLTSVSDKVTIDDEKFMIYSEAFMLTTKGGTSLTVNISNSRRAQESVNAMRALLREKKQS